MHHAECSMTALYDMQWLRSIAAVMIIVHALTQLSASRCMFDAVKPRTVVRTNISYSVTGTEYMKYAGRYKRDASDRLAVDLENNRQTPAMRMNVEDIFKPIRINAYFSSSTEHDIDAVQRTRLEDVIDRLVLTASQIFSGKLHRV